MASVTINGHTYTDDANPSTGMANGGHRTRLIPLMQDVVTVAAGVTADKSAAAASAATAVNAPGTQGTSTTSLVIGTGSKTLTIQTGKSIVVGMTVKIANTAAPTNWMAGDVTAYNSGTGSLTVNVSLTNGSGTYAAWTVSLSAAMPTNYATTAGNNYTGAQNEAHGADIASAATLNLTNATGNLVDVTGTTTITAITLGDGAERVVRFAGALTLTNSGSLVLPGGANITTAAGDFAVFRGYSAGVVRCVSYTRADGRPVKLVEAGLTMTGAVNFAPAVTLPSGATVDLGVAGSNNITISGSVTITSLGTAADGVERKVTFSGSPTITHNATSLILPGNTSITAAAGDTAEFVSLGAGNWRCRSYTRKNGTALAGLSGITHSSRSSNTILGLGDKGVLIDATGTWAQTFTAAATLGNGWFCYVRNSGTGDITLDPNGSEVIDGLTSYAMYPGEARLIVCTGSAFVSTIITPFYLYLTSSKMITIPPGYRRIGTRCIGGGGGGGGGRGSSTGSSNFGGSGGGGGACHENTFTAPTAGSAEWAEVGAGGTGGVGGTNANGSSGSNGGTSSFGSYVYAYGGGLGNGGSNTYAGSPGGGGGILGPGVSGGVGGLPSNDEQGAVSLTASLRDNLGFGGAGATTDYRYDGGRAVYGGGAGGVGGGMSSAVGRNGGGSIFGGGGGGGGGGNNAGTVYGYGTGGSGNSFSTGGGYGQNGVNGYGGSGNAGGAGSISGPGGNGGAGGFPGGGGGGGGGCAFTGAKGGDGGSGGNGLVIVWGVA